MQRDHVCHTLLCFFEDGWDKNILNKMCTESKSKEFIPKKGKFNQDMLTRMTPNVCEINGFLLCGWRNRRHCRMAGGMPLAPFECPEEYSELIPLTTQGAPRYLLTHGHCGGYLLSLFKTALLQNSLQFRFQWNQGSGMQIPESQPLCGAHPLGSKKAEIGQGVQT